MRHGARTKKNKTLDKRNSSTREEQQLAETRRLIREMILRDIERDIQAWFEEDVQGLC